MKSEELLDAMDGVSEKLVADAGGRKKKRPWKWALAAAACAALILGGAALLQPGIPAAEPITLVAQGEEGGPKKFLNYGDCQYTYVENGAAFALPEEVLGEPLGTLEHQIVIGQEAHLKDNFAATYAVGGTLHTLGTYDPAFRLAVVLDGRTYLCERSGHLDGTPLDVAAYFEAAQFTRQVQTVTIYDHRGETALKTVKGGQAETMVALLAQSQPAELEEEDYQRIGEAQSSGDSFQLALELPDSTEYRLYVIPSLEISMVGNSRCTLPSAFNEKFGSLFEKIS